MLTVTWASFYLYFGFDLNSTFNVTFDLNFTSIHDNDHKF
jgi:hypothetical protein